MPQSVQGIVDNQRFLVFYSASRTAKTDLEEYKSDHGTLEVAHRLRLSDLDRVTKLVPKKAATAHELKLAKYRSDLSALALGKMEEKISRAQVNIDICHLHMRYAKGEPEDIQKLYPLYRRQWESQCREAKVDVKMAEVKLAFAEYDYEDTKLMAKKKIVTQEELEDKEIHWVYAQGDLLAKKKLDEDCWKDVPEMEDIGTVSSIK